MRNRSVRILILALVSCITAALGLATMAATGASGLPAKTFVSDPPATVLLPTGDRVFLTGPATKRTVRLLPAAASGPGRVLVRAQIGADLYVMPADAHPYLGRFLDPELFDVTKLAAAATSNGRLPVRISYRGSKPAVPGVTITSASAGVATGYLTPASAAAFGRALTATWQADSRAHWPARSTLFTGVTHLTASNLPSSGTVKPNYPMLTLKIKTIGGDGKPQPDESLLLANIDDLNKYAYFVEIVNGEARVSVPVGHYTLLGEDFAAGNGASGTLRIASATEYRVARTGQTLTIDYRKANQHPVASAPKPAIPYSYSVDWFRTDLLQEQLGVGYTTPSSTKVLLMPASAAKVGALDLFQSWQLTGPGPKPGYSYDLAVATRQFPASPRYTFSQAQLGTVKASYYSDGTAKTEGTLRTAIFPAGQGGGFYEPVAGGTARSEYVGTIGGSPIWPASVLTDLNAPDDPGEVDELTPPTIRPGTTRTITWLRGPLAAGVPTQTTANGYCYACRTSKDLSLSLEAFLDSAANHVGFVDSAGDGLAVGRFRFYQNGKLTFDQDDALGADLTVPTAKAKYTAILDVDRRQQDPNESTQSQTQLTFSSASGTGGKPPSSWYCDAGETSACRVLPILLAKVALPTSLTGTLPAGKSTVTLTAAQVQYATKSAISSATLSFRPAGWGWTSVKLKSLGNGKFQGTIDNTGYDGLPVDLQLGAADKAGSSYQQTVVRAYSVARS